MSPTSKKRFRFSTLLSFGNSQKSAEAMSGEFGGSLEAKNMPRRIVVMKNQ
jgi:hypothetical protein